MHAYETRPPPAGYEKLQRGVICKCPRVHHEHGDQYWCCKPVREAEARAEAAERASWPKVHAMPGVTYRHRKTGGIYEVESIATIEATMTTCVIYRAKSDGRRWVRPLDEFCDGRFAFSDEH